VAGARTSLNTRSAFVPPDPPRTPKAAGTRRLLIDVAARLFVERGYNAVSLNEIASAAGLTKGAMYGHFRSKGQLLVDVIRCMLADRDHSPDFAAALTEPQLKAKLFFDEQGREIRLLEVDAAAAARHDADVAAGLADLYQQRFSRISDAMQDADDPETAAWIVAALANGIGMREAARIALPRSDRLTAAILTALEGFV
jgi:AcrR family transcriptional regulator